MRFFLLNVGNAQPILSSNPDPSVGAGLYGPYNLGTKVVGVWWAGYGGGTVGNIPAVGGEPIVGVSNWMPTQILTVAVGVFAVDQIYLGIDGVSAKRWVRFATPSQTWYFSTGLGTGPGQDLVFGLIEDECFESY